MEMYSLDFSIYNWVSYLWSFNGKIDPYEPKIHHRAKIYLFSCHAGFVPLNEDIHGINNFLRIPLTHTQTEES